MKQPLKNRIIEVRALLEADDKQMARHLKMSLTAYKEIEGGGRVLPMPARKTIEKRLERMLDVCGLQTKV